MHTYQDLQKGLDLGLISPEVLQNFFDLEQYPLISELAHRFQVCLRSMNEILFAVDCLKSTPTLFLDFIYCLF